MPIYGMAPGGATINYTAYDYNGRQLSFDASPVPPPPPVNPRSRSHNVAVFENEAGPIASVSDADALAQANAYDLMSVQLNGSAPNWKSRYTAAQLTAMHAANPAFKVVTYTNGGEYHDAITYPDSYYAHDAAGNKLQNTSQTSTLFEMQPDSGWVGAHIALAQGRISVVDAAGHPVVYDGEFADVLGDSPLTYNPVFPGTATKYTSAQWYAMTSAFGASIKAANPGKFIYVNGLANASKYFGTSRALLSVSGAPDAALCEGYIRTAFSAADSFTGSGWTNCVTMLQNASALGKSVVCMTKDWRTSVTQDVKTATLQYAFATFLLGDDGTHYFAASQQSGIHTMDVLPWLSNTDYGTPTGPYTIDGNGCYYRSFTKSSIGVNPTSVAHSMTVGGQTSTVQPYRAVFVMSS